MIENFGSNIARLRKEFNMSQTELAEKIGVQKQSISNIERGTRYPTFETLEKFANIFHATPMQLFGTPKEVALADTPAILDRIDAYDERIRTLFELSKIMDSYPVEEISKVASEAQYIANFFTPHPSVDEDGVPNVDASGKVVMKPALFDRLPLDKITEAAEKIDYINKNGK